MIRRWLQYASGEKRWLMISQIVHARAAAVLAEEWGAPFAGLEPRHILLAAIYRHEDGWVDHDAKVRINNRTHLPIDFGEVPTHPLLELWRGSINSAVSAGPLAAYLVSRLHTDRMLPLFSFRSKDDPDHAAQAAEFLDEQKAKQGQWLSAWQAGGAARRSEAVAETCIRWVRLFDELSLWLCRGRNEAHDFEMPDGRSLRVEPIGESDHLVMPWPFRGRRHVINVPARSLPVMPPEQILSSIQNERPVTLRFPLVAEPGA